MKRGDVDTLIILGGNPVYTAPADLNFGGEHLVGELKATYCALAATQGTACGH